MGKTRINVSVSDATAARLQSVSKALRKQGMKVDSVLGAVGIITGSVEQSKLASLKVKGATVEVEGGVQLPPPDSPVQ